MAIPIGLISQIFSDIWKARGRILFLKRLKNCLLLQGVEASDALMLFDDFDTGGSGELGMWDWKDMMKALDMNLSNERRHCGFYYFAPDDALGVSQKRFVRLL